MFFELEGKTYRIKFYRTGKTTVAELFEVTTPPAEEEDEKGMISLGVYGLGRPHHSERQFVKSVGRKAALANLLAGLSDPEMEANPIILSKEDREMIWAKYFETHRK